MTCIAAKITNGKITMGGDSAGTSGYVTYNRKDPKVFVVGPAIFGCTTSYRMTQLLQYKFKMPDHDPRISDDEFMRTVFIDTLRTTLSTGGYASTKEGVEQGGTFLVGYHGHVYTVEGDYQVGEQIEPFAAVGSGAEIALGSLYSMRKNTSPDSDIVKAALEAAENYCAGVRRPFTILELK